MNVLIYYGNGTSFQSVKQTYNTLKTVLGHAYDVMKVDAHTLKSEPWESTCSLIVMPGGRDLPYCADLNGLANDKIKAFVKNGGRYLGFCAGAYYASKEIEFEKGIKEREIVGTRELDFYPGLSRGTMFPGFVYNSEKGARAISLHMKNDSRDIKAYYNGGGYFVKAKNYPDQVKVICTYKDPGLCKDEQEPAAGVLCKVGKGSALLFGAHPEYDVNSIDLSENENRQQMIDDLNASAPLCRRLLLESLCELGLKVTPLNEWKDVPEVTPLFLTAVQPSVAEHITSELLNLTDDLSLVKDDHDTFFITQTASNDLDIADHLKSLSLKREAEDKSPVLKIICPTSLPQNRQPVYPERSLTPFFDFAEYYQHLINRRKQEWGGGAWYRLGNSILYSEVITSTQTVLDKNYNFAQCLPDGVICLATHQTSGRGRGKNSWVSQAGAVQYSFIIRHSLKLSHAPVVFIQYLTALSIVESIRTQKGYENIPLRLKWPNDIYVDLPNGDLKKVGGLLVNSSFINNEFLLVIGCGVNLDNPEPTVSINEVIRQHNPRLLPLKREEWVANAMVTFENMYLEFCEKGVGPWFLNKYYKRWLHSDKLVTLTTHDNVQAKIIGITSDYGLLEAEDIHTRKKYKLQPDGNSFDMLKGLIIKKE
ncbi:biotin-protein ligase [Pilobolus umbonatus]|nr:biotin-protein ligase [Pilobolus umbonatus]